MQAPGLDMNFFAHQPLWLVVFQSYLPLNIFTSHNFDIDNMEEKLPYNNARNIRLLSL